MKKQNRSLKPLLTIFYLFILSFVFSSCESQKTIVNGLEEKEANEIIVYLSTRGIDTVKVRTNEGGAGGGNRAVVWDIAVKQSQATEAMSLLNQVGLPRRRSQNLLNLFSTVGLVPSELQEQIRYQAGIAEQIASTIRKIDGILDAEVQISFPKEDLLNPGTQKERVTASVYVKHNGVLDDPNSHLTTRIKRLVSASVTGLDYDNVTIIPDRARASDLSGTLFLQSPDDRAFVNVWGVTVAKDSLRRFRFIFFSFLLLTFLSLLSMLWMLWKFFPIIKHLGFKQFLKFEQLGKIPKIESAPKEEKSEEDQE
ncbi:Nodulation protein NolT precursor [Candidatus Rubidus massiliensis]|nr:Nodulation protein NolT precursor [Candidatus Rubidus massiliensis]